ncbi:MAG: DUF4852 domain-containing protein [Pirellulaceae bacterium]
MLSLISHARFATFGFALTLAVLAVSSARAHEFSWDNLALAEIKLAGNFDYDNHVDWYMQKYRPSVWKSCKDDEFTLDDRRQETLSMFREKVEQFDETQVFYLRARMSVGAYDFKANCFPIQNMGPTNYWYESIYSSGDMPSNIRVFMKNYADFKTLPMPKDQARSFVSSRKNRSGNVDRNVYAMIELKMVDRRGRGELNAEIQSATFYADNSHTRFLGQFKKPTKTEPKPTLSLAADQATANADGEVAPAVPAL